MTDLQLEELIAQLKTMSSEQGAELINSLVMSGELTSEQALPLIDIAYQYKPVPGKEYTSQDEEFIGEITSDVNGKFENGNSFVDPIYEKDGDIDRSESDEDVVDGHYYFLRPFPVEGAYVLEIYRRNDDYAYNKDLIESLKKDLNDPDVTNYTEKRNELYTKKDAKDNKSLNEWIDQLIESKNTIINQLTTYDYENKVTIDNNLDAYTEWQEVEKDESKTEDQKAAAKATYHSAVNTYRQKIRDLELDLVGAYNAYYNVLLTDVEHLVPNKNEEQVEAAKTEYNTYNEKFLKAYLQLVNYTITAPELEQNVTTLKKSSTNVQSGLKSVKRLDEKFRKSKIDYDDKQVQYNEAVIQLKQYGPNAKDKKFLAYKILNRNKDNPDSYGLYREVTDIGDGCYTVSIKRASTDEVLSKHKVDNKIMYPGWETPDRYFITFEKLESGTPMFHVSCGKSGFFSDTEGILTYSYKGNNSSPTIGNVFNNYDSDGCLSIKRYRTTFKFLNEEKVYRTTTTNSRGKGIDAIRYGLFDARKPYPIKEEEKVEQITRKQYNELTAKEKVKYHKIGAASMDVDMQKIMEVMDQVKPLVNSLMPITQVMGSLQPLIGALDSAKSLLDTVKSLLQTVQSAIDTIAGLPIVGVVASPLKGILDIIKSLAGAVVIMYTKNYALLQRIRDIKDQLDPDNIKAKIKEITETLDAHYNNLIEKINKKKQLAEKSTLEENDKKKMDVISPTDETTKARGSGESMFANFNASALIPEIPQEVLDQIQKVKSSIDQLNSIVDTISTIKDMGDQVDEAMTTISNVKGILTGTPPMEMIVENIRKEALADIQNATKEIEKYDKEQKDLADKAKAMKESSLAYEKTTSVTVNLPLEEVVDEQTVKERAKPKVEG